DRAADGGRRPGEAVFGRAAAGFGHAASLLARGPARGAFRTEVQFVAHAARMLLLAARVAVLRALRSFGIPRRRLGRRQRRDARVRGARGLFLRLAPRFFLVAPALFLGGLARLFLGRL